MKQQLVNTNRISISDFTFDGAGEFGYIVTFFSTKTNKQYICKTINSELIRLTLKSNSPKQRDLILLKKLCKKWKQLNIIYSQRFSSH